MLKGNQKKLDKNNNGRIDAQDFKILQGSKKGMRMGGAVDRGMGLQDETMKPGKVMKANKGKAIKKAMETASRMANPGVAVIKDVSKLYKKYKDMQERKKNEKKYEQVEAKKGKMIRAKKGKYI